MNDLVFDWNELAFGSKKPLKELRATFIAAPREISQARLTQLVQTYLPQGNIILGLAKEEYIAGFEGQPQFRTLQQKSIQSLLYKLQQAKLAKNVYILHYFQREAPHIIEKLKVTRVVLVNGSWQYVFHMGPLFYKLISLNIPYQLVSPFCDEAEAMQYERNLQPKIAQFIGQLPAIGSETVMLNAAKRIAMRSYDTSHQTGAVLAKPYKSDYKLLIAAHNRVVPYETFALHHGALREKYFSPAGDLNYYDAIHAEVCMLLAAQKQQLDITNTTLFINLLPCPTCARMFCDSDINEFVYAYDHSAGYAVALLEKAGKVVRRLANL